MMMIMMMMLMMMMMISQLAGTKFSQSFSRFLSHFVVLLEGISWPISPAYSMPQKPGACSWFRR
jgi:hypothetical protein